MRSNFLISLFIGFFAVTLAGCQPLERPFQPEKKTGFKTAPGPRASLYVAPIENGPEELRLAMEKKLQDLGIAAFGGEVPENRYALKSQVILKKGVSYISWTIVDPYGRDTQLKTAQKIGEINEGLDHGDIDFNRIALKSASEIDIMLGGSGFNFASLNKPVLFVPIVENAPGDGSETLSSAMQDQMIRYGIDVLPDQWKATYVLKGRVDITKPSGGMQIVSIVWKLERRNGEYVGKVEQKNRIRAGTLDGPWGEVAQAAAQGGARGIMKLLRQVEAAYFQSKSG